MASKTDLLLLAAAGAALVLGSRSKGKGCSCGCGGGCGKSASAIPAQVRSGDRYAPADTGALGAGVGIVRRGIKYAPYDDVANAGVGTGATAIVRSAEPYQPRAGYYPGWYTAAEMGA